MTKYFALSYSLIMILLVVSLETMKDNGQVITCFSTRPCHFKLVKSASSCQHSVPLIFQSVFKSRSYNDMQLVLVATNRLPTGLFCKEKFQLVQAMGIHFQKEEKEFS